MREYYGELSNCLEYIEDKGHKAIPWKDYAFSFELQNSTEYTLELKSGKLYNSFATVKPKEKIQIQFEKYEKAKIFVSTKENVELECNFEIELGCMVKRNFVEHVKGKIYIAPVFKNGIITIVTCDNCGPDLGVKPQYKVVPLKEPTKKIKVCNFTPYDIIISTENEVIQRIEGKKNNDKCTSKFIGIPLDCILYADTASEEIVVRKDGYNIREDAIFRVNGCCIKIRNGSYSGYVTVVGPVLSEPYIRHLYVSFAKDLGKIEIWCNTIDYRLD